MSQQRKATVAFVPDNRTAIHVIYFSDIFWYLPRSRRTFRTSVTNSIPSLVFFIQLGLGAGLFSDQIINLISSNLSHIRLQYWISQVSNKGSLRLKKKMYIYFVDCTHDKETRSVTTTLSRESLYKALSGERKPTLDTVLRVVRALGLKLRAEAVSV